MHFRWQGVLRARLGPPHDCFPFCLSPCVGPHTFVSSRSRRAGPSRSHRHQRASGRWKGDQRGFFARRRALFHIEDWLFRGGRSAARFKTTRAGDAEYSYEVKKGNTTHGVVLSADGLEAVVHVPYYGRTTTSTATQPSAFDYLTVTFADESFVDLSLTGGTSKFQRTNASTVDYNSTVRKRGAFPCHLVVLTVSGCPAVARACASGRGFGALGPHCATARTSFCGFLTRAPS